MGALMTLESVGPIAVVVAEPRAIDTHDRDGLVGDEYANTSLNRCKAAPRCVPDSNTSAMETTIACGAAVVGTSDCGRRYSMTISARGRCLRPRSSRPRARIQVRGSRLAGCRARVTAAPDRCGSPRGRVTSAPRGSVRSSAPHRVACRGAIDLPLGGRRSPTHGPRRKGLRTRSTRAIGPIPLVSFVRLVGTWRIDRIPTSLPSTVGGRSQASKTYGHIRGGCPARSRHSPLGDTVATDVAPDSNPTVGRRQPSPTAWAVPEPPGSVIQWPSGQYGFTARRITYPVALGEFSAHGTAIMNFSTLTGCIRRLRSRPSGCYLGQSPPWGCARPLPRSETPRQPCSDRSPGLAEAANNGRNICRTIGYTSLTGQ
jgi:hypothetical protein